MTNEPKQQSKQVAADSNTVKFAEAAVESTHLVAPDQGTAHNDQDEETLRQADENGLQQSSPESFAPTIAMPMSIVSKHSDNATTAGTLDITSDVIRSVAAWEKPKPMIGLTCAILFLIFDLFNSLVHPDSGLQFALVPFQIFGMSCYWSSCVFRIAGRFTYSSAAQKRYARTWNALLAFLYLPGMYLFVVVPIQAITHLLINYHGGGQISDAYRAVLWALSISLFALPILTTRNYFRFMRRLTLLANDRVEPAPDISKRPAIIFASCHLIPILIAYPFLLTLYNIRNTPVLDLLALAFPVAVAVAYIVPFCVLSSSLKKLDK